MSIANIINILSHPVWQGVGILLTTIFGIVGLLALIFTGKRQVVAVSVGIILALLVSLATIFLLAPQFFGTLVAIIKIALGVIASGLIVAALIRFGPGIYARWGSLSAVATRWLSAVGIVGSMVFVIVAVVNVIVSGISALSAAQSSVSPTSVAVVPASGSPTPLITSMPSPTPTPTTSTPEPTPTYTLTPAPTATPTATPIFALSSTYNVAIAQFDDHLASQKVMIVERLEDDLRATLRSYGLGKNVDIKIVPQVVTSEDEARKLAQKIGSNIVIYGLYDDIGIRVRMLLLEPSPNLSDSKLYRLGELPIYEMGSKTASLSFYIHDVLPQSIAFVSLYAIGHLYYFDNNYAAGHTAFDAATSTLTGTVRLENEALSHFFNARSIRVDAAWDALATVTETTQFDFHKYEAAETVTANAACEYALAIRLDPNMFEAYNNLGVLLQHWYGPAPALAETGGCSELKELVDNAYFTWPGGPFSKTLQIRPDLGIAWYNLAASNYETLNVREYAADRGDRTAIEQFEKALSLDPTIVEANIVLGNEAVWAGKFGTAISHYSNALRLRQSPEIAFNLAQALALANRDSEAIAAFHQAIKLDTQDRITKEVHLMLGNLYHRQKKLDQAHWEYQQASGEPYSGNRCDRLLLLAKYAIDTNAWTTVAQQLEQEDCAKVGNTIAIAPYLRWLIGLIRPELAVGDKPDIGGNPMSLAGWVWGSASEMTGKDLYDLCHESDPTLWGTPSTPCLPAEPRQRLQAIYDQLQRRVHYTLKMNSAPFVGLECPYVFSQQTQGDEWLFDTTVLYGLDSPKAKGVQPRRLTRFDGQLLIREIEPETSYIDMLYVRIISADGRELLLYPNEPILAADDEQYFILHQGDESLITFKLPENAQPIREAWVVASGYYIPYGD